MLAFDPNNNYVQNFAKTKFVLGFALSIAALCIPTAVQAQTEASAANDVCTTYYINNAAYNVADMVGANARAALMAGLMSAVLPIGIGVASATANDSDKEQIVKKFIENQSKKNINIKEPVIQIKNIGDISSDCYNLIQVKSSFLKLEYSNKNTFEQVLFFSKHREFKTVYSKNFDLFELVNSPYKIKPTKRYKENREGKYVEVVDPVEDPSVQFEKFSTSLRQTEAKFVERIIKKQKIK